MRKHGRTGNTSCQFFYLPETVNHLFIHCSFTKQIWFWMGTCQDVSLNWHKFTNVIHFANQLSSARKVALLVSAVCWTIWRYRNELYFETGKPKSVKQIILLIISLVHYWAGAMKEQVQTSRALWLLVNLDEFLWAADILMTSRWRFLMGSNSFFMKINSKKASRCQLTSIVLKIYALSPHYEDQTFCCPLICFCFCYVSILVISI